MKKFVSSLVLFIYMFVSSPVVLIAQSIQQEKYYKEITVTKLIEKDKGGEVSLGRAKVVFPEGALKEDTEITIQALFTDENADESLENVTASYLGYRFLPSGEFNSDALVYLPYDSTLNLNETKLNDLYTYFYSAEEKTYIALERVAIDKENSLVVSKTNHFTDMINAVLTLPESPDSADVSLNSIKSLEAAVPDGHLIKFNPPKANNSGDASFSFTLDIPSGRRGLTPSVNIAYSSSGGNSEMGKGFSLSAVSSISIDTRHGVPAYDTCDTYMLDGVILKEKRRTDSIIEYESTRESSFKRIIRYNYNAENPENEYWIVTDKGGNQTVYGKNINSIEGSSRKISQWNMTEQKDSLGNSIRYSYIKDKGKSYIDEIRYTNWNSIEGNYRVKFNYTDDREDIRLNARSTQIIESRLLLMSVETYYKTQKIRTYSFTYKESYIGEKMLTSLIASNSEGESYSYNFSYEEMQKTADGKQVFFTEPMLWDNGLPLQVGRSSGSGTNYSGGAAAGVGTLFADVTVTGGWNGSSSSSDSFSDYTLSDMNGDGRADSITRGEDGTLWVGLNTGTGFSEKQRIYVNVSALDKSHSTESSTGWTFYAGGRAMVPYVASASLGYSNTGTDRRGTITNQSALMDMDGDGLTDIVETGKNTYLKNMGNLIFEEVPLKTSSSVSVRDISVPLTEEMMEKYQKTYLTETPFRVYVAPEDGTVEIKQSVRRLSLGNNPVRATSYYNSEAVPFREIDLTSGSEVEETDIHDVKKGDRLYFITDTGGDERAGDVKWNIKIRYTKLPLKLSEYKSVYLISEITEEDTDDSATGDSDEGLTVKDKELEKIEKYKALLKEYEFMPSVFTASLFEEYADELKVKAQSGSDDYSYFEDFPKHWIYDKAEQTYTLTEFEDIQSLKAFHDKYTPSEEIKKKVLEQYETELGSAVFMEDKVIYSKAAELNVSNAEEKRIGTVYTKKDTSQQTGIEPSVPGYPGEEQQAEEKYVVLAQVEDNEVLYDIVYSDGLIISDSPLFLNVKNVTAKETADSLTVSFVTSDEKIRVKANLENYRQVESEAENIRTLRKIIQKIQSRKRLQVIMRTSKFLFTLIILNLKLQTRQMFTQVLGLMKRMLYLRK